MLEMTTGIGTRGQRESNIPEWDWLYVPFKSVSSRIKKYSRILHPLKPLFPWATGTHHRHPYKSQGNSWSNWERHPEKGQIRDPSLTLFLSPRKRSVLFPIFILLSSFLYQKVTYCHCLMIFRFLVIQIFIPRYFGRFIMYGWWQGFFAVRINRSEGESCDIIAMMGSTFDLLLRGQFLLFWNATYWTNLLMNFEL